MAFGFGKVVGSLWNDITGAKDMQDDAQDYQKYMSDTAYARQVADMRLAGLNPALAMLNGAGGASTPSGSGGASGGNPIHAAVGLANSIGSLRQAFAQAKQAEETASSAEAQADYARNKNLLIASYFNSLPDHQKREAARTVFNSEFNAGRWSGDLREMHNILEGRKGDVMSFFSDLWNRWFGASSNGSKAERSRGHSAKTNYDYPVYREPERPLSPASGTKHPTGRSILY